MMAVSFKYGYSGSRLSLAIVAVSGSLYSQSTCMDTLRCQKGRAYKEGLPIEVTVGG